MEELPDSLDETYERILREIKKPNVGHARRMLQCLVAAVRPLRVAELAEILAFDFGAEGIPKLNPDWRWEDHEEAVMSTCSSLVMIVDDTHERGDGSDDDVEDEREDDDEDRDEEEVEDASEDDDEDEAEDESEDDDEYEAEDESKDDAGDEVEDESEHDDEYEAADESEDGNKAKTEDSRIVQFSHFSVKEFLMSSRLAESSRDVSHYHIELEPAHTIIAQACLGVLLQLDDRLDHDRIKDFPFATYTAQYWVEHARFKGVSSHIQNGMERLFDADMPHLSALLWIYNEDLYGRSMDTMSPEKLDGVPLYYAALFGFRDLTARLLAEHPEDVYDKGGFHVTPLHASASRGHTDVFLVLVEHFPNLDINGNVGQTPLHLASDGGHLEIGKWLLDHGADINAHDNDGWTPLYIAAMEGQLAFVRMLLENGAEINIPRETPLHMASENGYVEVARLLLEHGADLHARDWEDRTPFEVASQNENIEIVQLLSQSL
jgi:ankyrin repeat protein